MGKRITSLLITLAMIVAIVPCFGTAFALDAPIVTYKFYSDKELTTPITGANVGDIVYGVFSLNGVAGITSLNAFIGFDADKLQLVDFESDENTVDISADIVGITEDDVEGKGISLSDDTDLTIDFGAKVPAIRKVGDIGIVFAHFLNMSGAPIDITSDTKLVALRFKVVNEGTAKLISPVTYPGFTGGTQVFSGVDDRFDTQLIDPDYDVLLTINEASLSIVNVSSLDQPVTTKSDEKGIEWSEVDGAEGYEVTVTPSNSNITVPTVTKVTGKTFEMPSDIKYGDIKFSVRAYAGEDYSKPYEVTVKKTYQLGDVQNITLTKGSDDSVTASWDAVDCALSYELTVYENGVVKGASITVPAAQLSEDITSSIDKPDNGKNEYKITVRALGDGTYVLSGSAASLKYSNTVAFLGAVGAPTSVKWNDKTATWNHNALDHADVSGYNVVLYNSGDVVDSQTVGAGVTSYNFSDKMDKVGRYWFEVQAIGKEETGVGKYSNSPFVVSDYRIVSEKLQPVVIDSWVNRVVTWSDPNSGTSGYNLYLYKDDSLVKEFDGITDKTFDFDEHDESLDKSLIGVGEYKVVIQAVGDGTYYTDSDTAEMTKTFLPRLGMPSGLTWNVGNSVSWNPVVGANRYETTLYYEGEYEVDTKYTYLTDAVPTTVTWADFMDYPGNYTFSVTAYGVGAEGSAPVMSGPITNTVPYNGNVYITAYDDSGLTTPKTTFKAGDVFYLAIELENPGATAAIDFDGGTAPISYDKNYFKVLSSTGVNGFKTSEEMKIIDNENGMSSIGFYILGTENKTLASSGGRMAVAAFEMQALVKSDSPVVIDFAKVGGGNAYDPTAPSGFEYTLDGYTFFANKFPLAISNIEKGQLPKLDAPTWEGKTIVWNKYPSDVLNSAVSSYTLKLYKNGVLEDTITGIAPTELSKDLSDKLTGVGDYAVTVTAVGISTVAYDSPESDESPAYTIAGGGGSMGGSGGGGVVYEIKIGKSEGGTVAASATTAGAGKVITLTAKPDVGYKLDEFIVTDADGDPLDVSESNGKYTFVMPEGEVEISATFSPIDAVEFNDIDGHWAEEYIKEIARRGLVVGYGDGTFRPNWGITRAEFTKLMIDCLGLNVTDSEGVYDDTKTHWAKDYINLGTEIGIVNGIGNNLFAPDVIITREQIAAILFRLAGKPEGSPVSTFVDRDEITEYAKSGVDYVADKKYMIGVENNRFDGLSQTTRGQVATILVRLFRLGYFDELEIKGESSVFGQGDFIEEATEDINVGASE